MPRGFIRAKRQKNEHFYRLYWAEILRQTASGREKRGAFLKKFDNILCSEQKSRGCGLSVTLVLKNGRLFFEAEAQNARCSEREFKRICSEALKILKAI